MLKAIPYFPSYYCDSNGVIWRMTRKLATNAVKRISQYVDSNGYLNVTMYLGGDRRKRQLAHRLVASAFFGPCPDGKQCAHLNGIKTDNRPSNLAYVTPLENAQHKRHHGTMARGESQGLSKLTDKQVMSIRKASAAGHNQRALGRKYGLHESTIHRIRRGQIWTHLPTLEMPVSDLPDIVFDGERDDQPRPIPSYPGYYAKADGTVWKIGKAENRWPAVRQLSTFLNQDGYSESFLRTTKGKWTHRPVHSLVTEAFLGRRGDGYVVHHRDGVRTDNRIQNLAYVSYRTNRIKSKGNYT